MFDQGRGIAQGGEERRDGAGIADSGQGPGGLNPHTRMLGQQSLLEMAHGYGPASGQGVSRQPRDESVVVSHSPGESRDGIAGRMMAQAQGGALADGGIQILQAPDQARLGVRLGETGQGTHGPPTAVGLRRGGEGQKGL
jgi:hypothetical protein